MASGETTIICPKCGALIPIDAVLTQQVTEKVKKDLEIANKAKEEELARKSELLDKKDKDMAKAQEAINETVKKQVEKQIEDAKKSIADDADKKAEEKYHLRIAQLEKDKADAARKLEQGSQQTQGEVLELELEQILKRDFPQDDIIPVPKGVNGADITQRVKDSSGRLCGQIVWESKNTKTWNEDWIQKLKNDQLEIHADLAVIVSVVLPADIKTFGRHEEVWVCDVKYFSALAMVLRELLQSISQQKSMSVGKDEKMEVLYKYLTGVVFRQRIEAVVDAFTTMGDVLSKERLAHEKIWSKQEMQIKKIMKNTIGMYTDLKGLASIQEIKLLESGSSETGD
jgi:hypothetical protein